MGLLQPCQCPLPERGLRVDKCLALGRGAAGSPPGDGAGGKHRVGRTVLLQQGAQGFAWTPGHHQHQQGLVGAGIGG